MVREVDQHQEIGLFPGFESKDFSDSMKVREDLTQQYQKVSRISPFHYDSIWDPVDVIMSV